MNPELREAFRRPCWICRREGQCAHREPEVELAYLYAQPLPIRRPPGREETVRRADLCRANGTN